MAYDINDVTIKSSYTSPVICYDVKYTSKRNNNSKVTYTFKVTPWLDGNNSETWFGTGLELKCTITVNGVSGSATLKEASESWVNNTPDQKRATKTISITCDSTSAGAKQTVTFVVTRPDDSDGNSGKVSTSNYYVISPALISTKCTAPTTFTASSDNFEDNVTLAWSGAKAGTNQPIKSYLIRYSTSSDNATWSDYEDLETISSTSASGSKTIDMSSKVTRGYYVKFAIRTQPSNTDYVSSWKYSSAIRRKPYTKCTAPTTFEISQDVTNSDGFNTSIKLTWSGASGGTNNAINAYLIEYSVCDDNTSFYNWLTLQKISTTKTSYSFTKNVSSQVARGKYVKFRIMTQGTAGASYYSGYKASNSLRRNPYSKCTAPTTVTLTSEVDLNGVTHTDVFNKTYTIKWSGAKAGENNSITGYKIEYQESNTNNFGGTWSSWFTQANTTTSGSYTYNSTMSRGKYLRVRITTVSSVSGYNSSTSTVSNIIRRNSIPTMSDLNVSTPTSLEYSNGDTIGLKWNKATDLDNNIKNYEISIRYSQNNIWSTWQVLSSILTSNTTSYAFTKNESLYPYIANNQKVEFRIRARDVFGEYSSYSTCNMITRYDITGVSIGINGKWRSCQLFVGTNGSWVEQSVSAGVNNSWVDADGV